MERFFQNRAVIIALILGAVLGFFSGGLSLELYGRLSDQPEDPLDMQNDELLTKAEINSVSVVVDVGGAVHAPGVYTLKTNSRVAEAVMLAGGISPDASAQWVAHNVNLSQKVNDTEKIYIPFAWEVENAKDVVLIADPDTFGRTNSSIEGAKSTPASEVAQENPPSILLANVNFATAEELDALPGIGPSYADRIIKNRPYSSYEALVTKSGVPASALEKIKDLISYQ